jgi:prevent-host-death family protein
MRLRKPSIRWLRSRWRISCTLAMGSTRCDGARLGAAPAGWRPISSSHANRANVVAIDVATMSDVVASQVSVRDLKTHLSEWLGRVQAGEVLEVTSHRKPIAHITAVKSPVQGSANPLQKAIDAGVVSWNGQKPNFPPPVKLRGKGKLVSEIIMEDRD